MRKSSNIRNTNKMNLPGGLPVLPPRWDPPLPRNDDVVVGAVGLGGRGVSGGSKISRYLDTINTEMKYTMARDRNCACLVSSCENKFSFFKFISLYYLFIYFPGACHGTVGSENVLQATKSRVRFSMVSLEFFFDLIFSASLWPWGQLRL